MLISLTPRIDAKESKRIEIEGLKWFLTQGVKTNDKRSVGLWSPCTFTDNSRLQASAIELSSLALDFDAAPPLAIKTFRESLLRTGVEFVEHITHSSRPELRKSRYIIRISQPVGVADWGDFWDCATFALGVSESADKACRNPGRFYFLPSHPEKVECEYFEGKPLPVQEIMALGAVTGTNEDLTRLRRTLLKAQNVNHLASIRLALAGKPISGVGDRDNATHSLAWYIGRYVVPPSTTPDALLTLLGRGLAFPGSETVDHWHAKFKDSYARGLAAREQARIERQAQQPSRAHIQGLQVRTNAQGEGFVISNTFNASLILQEEGTWHFRKNLLEETVEVAQGDDSFTTFQDTDATEISNWLQQHFRITLSKSQVFEQVEHIAACKPFDPLKEYLRNLRHDGVNRIDSLFSVYFGCKDQTVDKLYSRKWAISLVARALRPGCKCDTVLVLQGSQGLGKSTSLRILSDPWFSDSRMVIGDKDSMLAASRFWIHEIPEMASFRKADQETLKAFFTSPCDSFRPPYGRAIVQRERRGVFVATTNNDEFLEDDTGNRRYWVVKVEEAINFQKLEEDKDQLLAEAVAALDAGEIWWLDGPAAKLQELLSKEFEIRDAFENVLFEWWERQPIDKRPQYLRVSDLLRDVLQVPTDRMTHSLTMRGAKVLRRAGWRRVHIGTALGRFWAYEPPVEWTRAPQRNSSGQVTALAEVASG